MDLFKRFSHIKGFVFDIDGVLTNGQLLVQEDGTLLRSMNIKDGYALQLAVKKGYVVVIISGGNSEGAKIRLQGLGVQHIFIGVTDKTKLLKDLMILNKWDSEFLLYMGDDMPDLAVMGLCGVKTCPNDAILELHEIADYISPLNGGQGCVRDVVEKVLKIQGNWE